MIGKLITPCLIDSRLDGRFRGHVQNRLLKHLAMLWEEHKNHPVLSTIVCLKRSHPPQPLCHPHTVLFDLSIFQNPASMPTVNHEKPLAMHEFPLSELQTPCSLCHSWNLGLTSPSISALPTFILLHWIHCITLAVLLHLPYSTPSHFFPVSAPASQTAPGNSQTQPAARGAHNRQKKTQPTRQKLIPHSYADNKANRCLGKYKNRLCFHDIWDDGKRRNQWQRNERTGDSILLRFSLWLRTD